VAEGMGLTAEEVYRRARAVRLRVVRRVRTALAGTYRSTFRGPGIEFLEFAPYQPGDDVRRMDWLVSSRRRRPYVRRHAEERELRVLLALDVSASMDVGPPERTPRAMGCTMAAAVGLSAAWNGDRTGALLFGGGTVDLVPFRRGERHVLGIVSRMLRQASPGDTTDLRPALTRVRGVRGHAIVVLLSDFLCRPPLWAPGVRTLLAACARKHDVRAVRLAGPGPRPEDGLAFLEGEDAESGAQVLCSTGAAAGRRHGQRVAAALAQCRVRQVTVGLTDDWLPGLMALLSAGPHRAG